MVEHIVRVFQAFVSVNGLHAFIESGVILFFWGAVAMALTVSLRQSSETGKSRLREIASSQNFRYVATAVAGLVLTASTGAIGSGQSTTPPQASSFACPESPTPQQASGCQRLAFQRLCAWSYIMLGVACLFGFVVARTPHDLVKTIALTTLGFAGTIIGGLAGS